MEDILSVIFIVIILGLVIYYFDKKKDILLKNIFKGVLVFFLFYFSSVFAKIPMLIFNIKYNKSTSPYLSIFSNTCLAIVLIFMYRKELLKEFKKFKDKFSDNMDVGFRYWMIGLVIMMVSNILISAFVTKNQATNEQLVQDMIKRIPIIMIINAGIIAPFVEEITFRKCFKNIFKNKWLFLIISSLVFGSLHVLPGIFDGASIREIFFLLPYSALGFVFALMYYDTDTVFTSYTMHVIHNTILIILSILK